MDKFFLHVEGQRGIAHIVEEELLCSRCGERDELCYCNFFTVLFLPVAIASMRSSGLPVGGRYLTSPGNSTGKFRFLFFGAYAMDDKLLLANKFPIRPTRVV